MLAAGRSLPLQRDFVYYFLSRCISLLGDAIHQIALLSLVYATTHSLLVLGGTLFSMQSSHILFGLFSGIAADRFNRKWIMVTADLYRAVAVVAIPFLPSTALLFLVLFSLSCAESFYNMARASLLPDMLPHERELVTANSLLQAATTVIMIVGPLAGAAIVVSMGAKLAFFIDGLTFLVATLLILPLHAPTPMQPLSLSLHSIAGDLAAGKRYLVQTPKVVALLITSSLLLSSIFLPSSLKIAFADQFMTQQGLDATTVLGYLGTASGLGGLLGAMVLPFFAARCQTWHLISIGSLCASLELFSFAFFSSLPLILAATVLSGCAFTLVSVPSMSLVQSSTPGEVRGKLLAFYSVVLSSITTLAVLAGGALAGMVGIKAVYFFAGLICVAAGIIAYFRYHRAGAA